MNQNFKIENKFAYYLGEFLIIEILIVVLAILSIFNPPENGTNPNYFYISSLSNINSLIMIGYALSEDILLIVIGLLFYLISKKVSTSFLTTKKGIILYILDTYVAISGSVFALLIVIYSNATPNLNILNSLMQIDFLPVLLTWYLFSVFIEIKK